jgi:hypothetical protein
VADEIARELPGAEALHVVTFLAAGDALKALDQVGPAFGIEISADGLRRFARIISPTSPDDPLRYDPDVDPELRRLLGFVPGIQADLPADAASPLSFWPLATAWAAEPSANRAADWKGWVVEAPGTVGPYVQKVGNLLRTVASSIIAEKKLTGGSADFYRRLVAATAWQESCWRQFEARAGKVSYLRSRQGSVGMMQVNERVWRGFYETDKVRWKVAYNVRAGAEILDHYVDIAAESGAKLDSARQTDAAGAVYAAYNGGPGQLRRYLERKRQGKVGLKVVDELFVPKFEAIGAGVETKVAACIVGGATG